MIKKMLTEEVLKELELFKGSMEIIVSIKFKDYNITGHNILHSVDQLKSIVEIVDGK